MNTNFSFAKTDSSWSLYFFFSLSRLLLFHSCGAVPRRKKSYSNLYGATMFLTYTRTTFYLSLFSIKPRRKLGPRLATPSPPLLSLSKKYKLQNILDFFFSLFTSHQQFFFIIEIKKKTTTIQSFSTFPYKLF